MGYAKKIHRPANDPHRRAGQKMAYVTLPQPYWDLRRVFAIGVLLGFAAIMGAVAALNWPRDAAVPALPMVAAPVPKTAEPFDIVLNASDLAPSAEEQQRLAALEQVLPPSIVITKSSAGHSPLPPVLEITVEDQGRDAADPLDLVTQARHQAAIARIVLKQGDVKLALHYQHRAVELDALNMLYRLDLAILYDRVDDIANAALLYRQVVQAFDVHDSGLPPDLNILPIRQRLDYLSARARK